MPFSLFRGSSGFQINILRLNLSLVFQAGGCIGYLLTLDAVKNLFQLELITFEDLLIKSITCRYVFDCLAVFDGGILLRIATGLYPTSGPRVASKLV